jgi:organic radical activating enzyme
MKYNVSSIMYLINEVLPHYGLPVVVVRLFGCNLRCPDCPEKQTWDYLYTDKESINNSYRIMTARQIADQASELVPNSVPFNVLITGGEPLLQNLRPLVDALQMTASKIIVETNGTIIPPRWSGNDPIVWVVSPKRDKVHDKWLKKASFFRYVIPGNTALTHNEDGLPIVSTRFDVHPSKVIVVPNVTHRKTVDGRARLLARQASRRYGYRYSRNYSEE